MGGKNGNKKKFAVETSLRDLKILTQKKIRNLKSDEEDGLFDESEAYNFDNENDTSYEEQSENENKNLQKRGSNHSDKNEDRSEESDSLSPLMERLSIEIELEKAAEKSNLCRKRERIFKK